MITDEVDPDTGLPLVKEERAGGDKRKRGEFFALPKAYSNEAMSVRTNSSLWFPRHMVWDEGTLMRYRCWKCGRDLAGWRKAINRHGHQILIGGQPAVWFRWYHHMTTSPYFAWWHPLQRQVQFEVTHCQDCKITDADGLQVVMCYLGGLDAGVRTVRGEHPELGIPAHVWASHLYRWSMDAGIGSEPIGTKPRKNMNIQRLHSPGKTITAADWLLWCDQIHNQQLPSGVEVGFKGEEIPAGWKRGPKPSTIVKL